ncbi:MAG: efflux RND transporter periplasmic adaptor subunit [Rhodoplanes sp.]|uniref:efflux RND transporter periplasmic adaptor subunit n=1 Tax=Rhodoplanes sp. TaxID=1968906 RepID=UPI0018245223|nr:efflux RND transporter periplasmic adaptor subunit [Rhodoplanes sp.]NVO12781.1 efflux RND transporter periplasmic adaptor subunit [Rhodoplanes sp.]
MTPRLRITLVAAIVGLVALAGFVVRAVLAPAPAADVMTAAVTVGDIEETVLASGTLKPVKLVAVGAQVSGRVTALKVTLGQAVAAGDLIAEIDSLTQQNALRTAIASLQNTRAQRTEKEATLANAEASLGRHQVTFAQKASSRADYDSAETTVKTTRAQIAQLDAQIVEAEVAVETARINLGYTRITAPIDGTVLAIVTQEGQTVNAVQSAPTIVVLGRLDVMTVRAEISEADVVKVRSGQQVYFTILGDPEQRFHATLESIEPAPESIRSDSSFSTSTTSSSSSSTSSSTSTSAIYYNGIFNVPNPEGRLRTYMTAQVRIVLGTATKVLTVPAAALGPGNGDGAQTVQVVGPGGEITSRPVTVGLNNKVMAEIRTGLREGERVVTGRRSSEGQTRTMGPPPPMGF